MEKSELKEDETEGERQEAGVQERQEAVPREQQSILSSNSALYVLPSPRDGFLFSLVKK
jgi:hypothetical protein